MTQGTAANGKVQAQVLHQQALQALSAGKLKQGIALLEQAVKNDPHAGQLRCDLGTAYWQNGAPAKAEQAYALAVQAEPENPFILNAAGAFQLEQRRFDAAEPLLRQAFALKPDHYEIPNNLGLLCLRQERLDEAKNLFAEAIRLNPTWPNAYVNLADVLAQGEHFDLAEKALRQALQLNPRHAIALSDLAGIYIQMRRESDAFACLRKALGVDASDALTWARMIDLLEKKSLMKETEAAIAEAKKHCPPDSPGIVLAEAKMLRRQGKLPEAAALIEKYRERLKSAQPRQSILAFFFEAGQLYDRMNEIDKAFDCFETGNAMQAKLDGVTEDIITRHVAHALKAYIPALAKPSCLLPAKNVSGPVFLVGFPRSGTTLLDQILSSHPDVEVVEERSGVDHALRRFAMLHGSSFEAQRKGGPDYSYLDNPCYPAALEKLRTEDIEAMREAYFKEQGISPDGSTKKILIDKLPLNILFAGFIKRIFPESKFILALRHPCDSVLSCYMQDFQINVFMRRYLHLKSAAEFYDEAFTLWDHYTKTFDLDYHAVHYEDVVANFQPTIEGLLKFLDLPWDDAVLKYDETAKKRKYISTPSYHQVTEKLYTRASGRWLRYRKHMEPVLDILAPHALKHGYSMDDTSNS